MARLFFGWRDAIAGDITVVALPDDFRAAAIKALPSEPWDETTWAAGTTAIKEATALKGKALLHPQRFALTGRESVPEPALLPLIGGGSGCRKAGLGVERYRGFAEDLRENGIAVGGRDHIAAGGLPEGKDRCRQVKAVGLRRRVTLYL